MESRGIVSSFPNHGHGVNNIGMEHDDMENEKFTRSDTALSEVDLDILSKQNMVGEERKVMK